MDHWLLTNDLCITQVSDSTVVEAGSARPQRRKELWAMPNRIEVNAEDQPPNGVYPWFTSSLIPRAIAWVSTTSAAGVDNLAPHSFTTVASVNPPTLCFVHMGLAVKDTLKNVRETGEFVLNIGSRVLQEAMNHSATAFPSHRGEFDEVGIEREASVRVRPPRVAGAPVAFECRFTSENQIGDGVMVFGEVVQIGVLSGVVAADGLPDARLIDPIARLGRAEWGTLGEVLPLQRLHLEQWDLGVRA
jgi:flavin reductase (DIM6/NTAB) family NADH-FMN oxidoreductase RutF